MKDEDYYNVYKYVSDLERVCNAYNHWVAYRSFSEGNGWIRNSRMIWNVLENIDADVFQNTKYGCEFRRINVIWYSANTAGANVANNDCNFSISVCSNVQQCSKYKIKSARKIQNVIKVKVFIK